MTRGLLTSVLVLSLACGTGGGLVSPNPTASEIQQVRAIAVRVADATTAGVTIADEAGRLLNQLPLSASAKDIYDCAILKVTGTTRPVSATVTKICGAVPSTEASPLTTGLRKLGAVTACPSLRATVSEVLAAIDPLISQLEKSGQAALSITATALRATFAFARQFLGGSGCASISIP